MPDSQQHKGEAGLWFKLILATSALFGMLVIPVSAYISLSTEQAGQAEVMKAYKVSLDAHGIRLHALEEKVDRVLDRQAEVREALARIEGKLEGP